MPNVLVCGRGGYSFLRVEETTDFKDVKRLDIKTDGTQKGFLFGAGVEAAVASSLSARAECNRGNYGDGLKSSKMQLGCHWASEFRTKLATRDLLASENIHTA